jgi:hypothetical protein
MIRTVAAAITAVSLLSLVATSATAQDDSKRKARDPNEVVCKKEEVLGSRLQTRKVCMTRAEWAEQRQLDRQNVERSQTNTCQRQAGC